MEATIQIPEEVLRAEAAKQIEEKLANFELYILLDVNKVAELMCMSTSFVEEVFMSDVRMKQITIRKNRKRWFKPSQAKEAIYQIVSEW